MHTDDTEQNMKWQSPCLKANHSFFLSQSKICKQKHSVLRVHTIIKMHNFNKVTCQYIEYKNFLA